MKSLFFPVIKSDKNYVKNDKTIIELGFCKVLGSVGSSQINY